MGTANSLEDLRRRMAQGAAPGAFAAQAEEHRRAGRLDEAVAVCRDGLQRYPTYVSARVTLGRALLDLGDVDAAIAELTEAAAQAPDNLAAARALDAARAQAPLAVASASPMTGADAAPVAEMTPADGASLAWLRPTDEEFDGQSFVGAHADPAPMEADDLRGSDLAPVLSIWTDGAIQGATIPEGALPASGPWAMSLDEAVAEVFAQAAGPVEAMGAGSASAIGAAVDEMVGPHPPAALGDLQDMLAAIRARRAELAEADSGVD